MISFKTTEIQSHDMKSLVDLATIVNQETTHGKAVYDDASMLYQMIPW